MDLRGQDRSPFMHIYHKLPYSSLHGSHGSWGQAQAQGPHPVDWELLPTRRCPLCLT